MRSEPILKSLTALLRFLGSIRRPWAGGLLAVVPLTLVVWAALSGPALSLGTTSGGASGSLPLLRSTSGRLVDVSELPGTAAAGAAGTVDRSTAVASNSARPIPGRLLLKFAPGVSDSAKAVTVASLGMYETESIPELGITVAQSLVDGKDQLGNVVQLSQDTVRMDAGQTLEAAEASSDVVWAEPDAEYKRLGVPNDPYYKDQWALPAVGLPAAWNLTTGSSSVTIAFLDSGLGNIQDFANRIVYPYSTVYNSSDYWAWRDLFGHGTACAGIAAAAGDDGEGVAGAAWNVKIMPVHTGDEVATISADIAAWVYAVDHGADIISYSSGGSDYTQAQKDAVDYALSHNVLVIASAGNDGAGAGVSYPARFPGVIAVGATNSSNVRASFSSTGNELALVAPGEDVLTYWYGGVDSNGVHYYSLGIGSGTSFSCPLVSGVAALMMSRNPSLTPSQIASILSATTDDLGPSGWDDGYGDGLLNAGRAVASAADAIPPSVSFTQPANASTVKGLASFVVIANDNVGVAKTELYVDGHIRLTYMPRIPHYYDGKVSGALYVGDPAQPVGCVLDTTKLASGSSHTVMAKTYDDAGNVTTAQVTVTVDNSLSTTTTGSTTSTTSNSSTTSTTLPSTTTTTSPPSTTTTTLPGATQFSDVPASNPYYAQISDLSGRHVVNGFPNGTFQPEAWVSRQQFAKMIVKSLGLPVSPADACTFTDVDANVDPSDPLYPDHYVAVCAANNITQGLKPDQHLFGPYDNLTRAQLITMVVRATDLVDPPAGYTPPFPVFDDTHYPDARKAAYAGLLTGIQGMGPSYDFFTPASRGEVCDLLYNLMHR